MKISVRPKITLATPAIIVLWLLWPGSALAHAGFGIVADRHGKVIFLDNVRGRVWAIDGRGDLIPFATGKHGENLVADADGNFFVEDFNQSLWKITPDSSIVQVPVPGQPPGGVGWLDELLAVDRDGNFYFSGGNEFRQGYWLIRKVTPAGEVTVLAGSVQGHLDGKGREARFTHLRSAAWGPDGSLYVSDEHSVRRVSPDGTVSTLAGDVTPGFADGPGHTARFERVLGLALDARGTVFVVDTDNLRVRKISPDGPVSTVIQVSLPWKPAGIAVAGDQLYVLEFKLAPPMITHWFTTHRVRKPALDGTVVTLATVGGGGEYLLSGALIVLVVGGWALCRRRRKAQKEKQA